MRYLPGRKYGVSSDNFVKENVLCEIGDEITRFDGTFMSLLHRDPTCYLILT
jgi:hypothetical protein